MVNPRPSTGSVRSKQLKSIEFRLIRTAIGYRSALGIALVVLGSVSIIVLYVNENSLNIKYLVMDHLMYSRF